MNTGALPRGTTQERHRQRESDLLDVLSDERWENTNEIVALLRGMATKWEVETQLYVGWDHGAVRGHLRSMERRGLVLRHAAGPGEPHRWRLPLDGSVWERRWGGRFIVFRVLRTWMNGSVVMVDVERMDPGCKGRRETRTDWWLRNRCKRLR